MSRERQASASETGAPAEPGSPLTERSGIGARSERPFQRDLSSPVEERHFEVGAPDHGRRLDAFLAERMAWRSRNRIQDLVTAGRVGIEPGKDPQPRSIGRVRAGTRLRRGNRLVVRLDSAFVDAAAEEEGRTEPGRGPLDRTGGEPPRRAQVQEATLWADLQVVYDDHHLLAVSKPPRMNVYPSRRHLGGSLTELVHRRHRALGLPGSPPSPCHRLDRETSGIVLYARDRDTRAAVGLQFEAREVEKTYLAIVAGVPDGEDGVIDLPLGRDPGSRVEIRQAPRPDGGGVAARTRWRVRTALVDRALIELQPETGRQHQLRAHLAAIGHPILGDRLYLGGDDLFLASLDRELEGSEIAALGGVDRLALHAWRLGLRHPASETWIEIEAPPPPSWLSGR